MSLPLMGSNSAFESFLQELPRTIGGWQSSSKRSAVGTRFHQTNISILYLTPNFLTPNLMARLSQWNSRDFGLTNSIEQRGWNPCTNFTRF